MDEEMKVQLFSCWLWTHAEEFRTVKPFTFWGERGILLVRALDGSGGRDAKGRFRKAKGAK